MVTKTKNTKSCVELSSSNLTFGFAAFLKREVVGIVMACC